MTVLAPTDLAFATSPSSSSALIPAAPGSVDQLLMGLTDDDIFGDLAPLPGSSLLSSPLPAEPTAAPSPSSSSVQMSNLFNRANLQGLFIYIFPIPIIKVSAHAHFARTIQKGKSRTEIQYHSTRLA
eukprot:scpid72602/ scgid32788/ 